MSGNMEWLSILPPLVAITVVLWRKEVILALFLAIFTSEALLLLGSGGEVSLGTPLFGLLASLERIISIFTVKASRPASFSLPLSAYLAA